MKKLSVRPESSKDLSPTSKTACCRRVGGNRAGLVRAAREQCHQHHQVRQGEQPLIRLYASRFRCPCDKTQMAALCEIVKVVYANPRKIGHLGIGENFLARFYGNHGLGPLFSPSGSVPTPLDA
jgi:hypothetical protein